MDVAFASPGLECRDVDMTHDRWPKLIGLRNRTSGRACDPDARVGKGQARQSFNCKPEDGSPSAAPVVMSLPPIPIPRPNRAPLESAGEAASTAQGRPNANSRAILTP